MKLVVTFLYRRDSLCRVDQYLPFSTAVACAYLKATDAQNQSRKKGALLQ